MNEVVLDGSRTVVCDGAMGTMLYTSGIELGPPLCALNVSKPELVLDLHRAYLEAGAQLIKSNTFDANRLRLSRAGLGHRVVELNVAGARLARQAVESSGAVALVAASVGPAAAATLATRFAKGERGAALAEQIGALSEWVDLIALETFGDIESLVQAVTIAHGECDLPVIAQLTFGDDGRTLLGERPDEAAAAIGALGVVALGANCTVGPAILQPVVAQLVAATTVPISVQPNAGTPRLRGKQVHYAQNVEYFAQAALQFVAAGAVIVGGCCGTTPAHIRAIADAVAEVPVTRPARSELVTTHPSSSSDSPAAPDRPASQRLAEIAERVADAALGGADAVELATVFARAVQRGVLLVGPDRALRAAAVGDGGAPMQWDPDLPALAHVVASLAADRRPLHVPPSPGSNMFGAGCVAAPIVVDGTVLGNLFVLDDPSGGENGELDLLVVSYAAALFALTLAHERASTELGLRYQAAVVDGLISGHVLDAADARRKALSIGLPANVPFRIGVVRVEPAAADGAYARLESSVDRFAAAVAGAVTVVRGWDVVTIVPEPDARPDRGAGPAGEVLAQLSAHLRDAGIDAGAVTGMSERTAHPERAPQAMRQAEVSIDIGRRLGRTDEVIAHDELGIYRLLLQIGDPKRLVAFAEDVLGPLLDYDANHKLELVRTLSVYLNEHASLKQTARRLGVHTNTISYRVQRIESLTPLDLDDADDRLMAHVAVKIVESLRNGAG